MGVYVRKDSPFYWALLDGYGLKESTKIPRDGGNPAATREARKAAEAFYARRMGELAALPTVNAKPVMSFAKHRQWYAEHHAAHLRGASRVVSILRQLAEYFDPFQSLAGIRTDDVREWMTWRKRQVAPSTVNRELDVLKSLLTTAVPRYLDTSPATGLRRLRVVEVEARVLTRDEEARLLAVGSPADRAWLILAMDTLLRLSSCVNLKWAQVKGDVIVPLNAKVKHDAVPITKRLAAALAELSRESEYVFPDFHITKRKQKGEQTATQRAERRFALLCKLARVDHGRAVDGMTIHCLRHTGATRALQGGASVRSVMKLGGWKNERMVMRYVHASDADVRAAAESIGS